MATTTHEKTCKKPKYYKVRKHTTQKKTCVRCGFTRVEHSKYIKRVYTCCTVATVFDLDWVCKRCRNAMARGPSAEFYRFAERPELSFPPHYSALDRRIYTLLPFLRVERFKSDTYIFLADEQSLVLDDESRPNHRSKRSKNTNAKRLLMLKKRVKTYRLKRKSERENRRAERRSLRLRGRPLEEISEFLTHDTTGESLMHLKYTSNIVNRPNISYKRPKDGDTYGEVRRQNWIEWVKEEEIEKEVVLQPQDQGIVKLFNPLLFSKVIAETGRDTWEWFCFKCDKSVFEFTIPTHDSIRQHGCFKRMDNWWQSIDREANIHRSYRTVRQIESKQ